MFRLIVFLVENSPYASLRKRWEEHRSLFTRTDWLGLFSVPVVLWVSAFAVDADYVAIPLAVAWFFALLIWSLAPKIGVKAKFFWIASSTVLSIYLDWYIPHRHAISTNAGRQTAGIIEHYATPAENEPAFKEIAGQLPMLTFGCQNLVLASDDLYGGREMPFLAVRGPSAGQISSPKSGAAFSLNCDGHYTLYAPNWDVNYNSRTIEVVDEYVHPVFQMIRTNNTTVRLVGFTHNFGITTLFGPRGELGSFRTTEPATQVAGNMLREIFVYPAWKYHGRLAESTDRNEEACPSDSLGRFGMITKGITINFSVRS